MKPEAHVPVIEYAHEHPVLQNPGETRTLDHLPQLDGIRAIAVSLVLWAHFQPSKFEFRGNPPWGAIGVGVFFTLSGFLITRILLNAKLKIEDRKSTFGQMLKQFYIRRFLRIFPLYYGVLIILWLTNATEFRHRAWYSFLYWTNYRFAAFKAGKPAIETHLWSLSVEEQFYIVWPLLVLICPRKLLLPLMALGIATGPIWRTLTYKPRFEMHEWMTPGCLDLLCMGGLLALLSLPRYNLSRWRDGFVQLCGLIGVPMIVAFVAQRWWPTVFPPVVARPTAVSFDWMGYGGATYPITVLTAVWLIGTAARGFRGPIGWFLTCPPVVYVGRISYGLYVIHMTVPFAIGHWYPKFGRVGERDWRHFFLWLSISFVLATLSWFCFESPINNLKRYFEYDKSASAKSPTPAAAA